MNKQNFINQLKRYLSVLSAEERNEIISFYEDRFNNASYEGKTESEIISELETPYEIAQNVLSEYGIEQQPKGKVDAASVIGIIFFDLFISSWLVPVLIFVPGSLAVSWFAYFTTFDVFFDYNLIKAVAAFLISSAVFVLYLIAIIYIIAFAIKVLIMILNWHVSVFTGKENRFNFSLFDKLNQLNINHKKLIVVAASSFALTLSLGMIWRATSVSAKGAVKDTIDVNEYQFFDGYDLDAEFVNMNVEVVPTSGDKLIITHYNDLDIDITYRESSDGLTIYDNSKSNWNNNTLSGLFNYLEGKSIQNGKSNIIMEVPTNNTFSEFSIYVENGGLDVNNVNSENAELNTINGSVVLENFEIDDAQVSSVNGKVDILDGQADELYVSLTNGTIKISNINTPSNDGNKLTASTVNGSVILDDVYIKDVNLTTVNGSIEYFNSDESYKLDDFDYTTVIGKAEYNVR